jgi:thiamine kinase-like enzyme
LNEAFINQAFDLLSRCHKLKVNAPTISYAGHIEHYWNILEVKNTLSSPSLFEQKEHMELVLKSLIDSGTSTGLCHHDPVGSNFVGSREKLYLIDWEYAARGLLVMDYAALGIEWGIDDDTVVAQTGIAHELLVMAKMLYGYICYLWEEQNGSRN